MSEYTIQRIQKESEIENIGYFIEVYQNITGEKLEVIETSERPDFICSGENGRRIGIELTKVTRGDPGIIQYDKIMENKDFMSIEHAMDMIQKAAVVKNEKRSNGNWKLADSNILLIELIDIPLNQLVGIISPNFLPDLYSTGFMEVWMADYTGIEAYDNIEVFCVQPKKWSGYYPRGIQKPYG